MAAPDPLKPPNVVVVVGVVGLVVEAAIPLAVLVVVGPLVEGDVEEEPAEDLRLRRLLPRRPSQRRVSFCFVVYNAIHVSCPSDLAY